MLIKIYYSSMLFPFMCFTLLRNLNSARLYVMLHATNTNYLRVLVKIILILNFKFIKIMEVCVKPAGTQTK